MQTHVQRVCTHAYMLCIIDIIIMNNDHIMMGKMIGIPFAMTKVILEDTYMSQNRSTVTRVLASYGAS